MFNNTPHVNRAGNISFFDKEFLAALKKAPTLSENHELREDPPGDNAAGASGESSVIRGPDMVGIQRGTFSGLSFTRSLRMAGDANSIVQEQLTETMAELIQLIDEKPSPYALRVNQRRQMIELRWGSWIYSRHPNLPFPDGYWFQTTIVENWKMFFVVLIRFGKGRSGEDETDIRSTTLQQWALTFTYLVGKKTTDKDGAFVGVKLLQQGGLFGEIKQHVAKLIIEFGLERLAKRLPSIGRPELLLMFQTGFQMTEVHGRIPFQQNNVAMVLVHYIAARMGSLGWSNEDYRKLEHYMKLEDLTIEREGHCQWSVMVTVKYRKGYNMTVDGGPPQRFKLDPVTKIHNVWFDAGMHVLVFLLMREALEGCSTLEDIFNYKLRTFRIKPSKLKEPLFLERGPKGLYLKTGAASATGMTASLRRLGKSADIDNVTGHAIRRETGNRTGLVLGMHVAQALLGHEEAQNTFSLHYSLNTLNLPVVQMASGELDHTAPLASKIALKRRTKSQIAVHVLIRSKRGQMQEPEDEESDDDGSDAVKAVTFAQSSIDQPPKRKMFKLSAEDVAKAEATPTVVQFDAEINNAWEEIFKLLPERARKLNPTRRTGLITSIFNNFKDEPSYKQNEQLLKRIQSNIVSLSLKRTKAFEAAKRPIREQRKKEEERSRVQLNPTTEEHDEAVKEMQEFSYSAKNLPKLDVRQLLLSSSAIRKGALRSGLLTPACQKLLSDPNLDKILEEEQDTDDKAEAARAAQEDEDGDAEEDITFGSAEEPNGLAIQKNVPMFKDVEELEVLDANLEETIMSMMEALYRPVAVKAMEDKLAQEHGGKYPCLLCKRLPKELKPNGKFHDEFTKASSLRRHLAAHSDWFLLRSHMFTDDDSEFKCPLEHCDFRAESIPDVEEHCISECKEHILFQGLKAAHEKRKTPPGSNVRDALNEIKRTAELAGDGLQLTDDEIEKMEWWADLDDEKINMLVERYDEDREELVNRAPGIRQMMRDALDQVVNGLLKVPNAEDSIDDIAAEALAGGMQARVDALVEKVMGDM
ncbi:hypothetical protein FRC08_018352 [Ceratobasidium sp. 394]|nr:hypothetical protein FRC08_018352 [Ceratobasidium sp. 394]